jgi:hypothetical protein
VRESIFIPIHDEYGTLSSCKPEPFLIIKNRSICLLQGSLPRSTCSTCHRVKKDAPFLILVEGVMDAFGWCLKGVTQNVVASFGKKISAKQVTLLKKLNPEAVACLGFQRSKGDV